MITSCTQNGDPIGRCRGGVERRSRGRWENHSGGVDGAADIESAASEGHPETVQR